MQKMVFLFLLVIAQNSFAAPCSAFRVYKNANLPLPFDSQASNPSENILIQKIGKIKTQEEFPEVYKAWLNAHSTELTAPERRQWLACILHYASLDSNGNGIPDWSGIVDHQPAKVLYPGEEDIDGDGIENILDPDPLNKNQLTNLNELPAHLKFKDDSQEKLFREFGIIAINHTDDHSALVLKELLSLLRTGFSKKWVTGLKNLKYIYAFLGHDPEHKIAAYHWNAKALSIGGVHAYKNSLTQEEKIALKAALAHEIGHAALLEKLSARELAEAGTKFGGWNLSAMVSPLTFYAKIFFAPYSFGGDYKRNNIVSAYALTNIHEWFADSFAAHVITKIGDILEFQKAKHSQWADYENLTVEYREWLDTRILDK
jgi:hypothetical protein